MLENAFIPLCRIFDDTENEMKAKKFSREILKNTIKKYWCNERKTFINNLPWENEENEIRLCDRSLSTALLYNQCPENLTENSLKALIECPKEMGLSYPANAIWRMWALSKFGRNDVVIKDLREKWTTMDSVILNNTLQEYWIALPDSESQWSHCPAGPLNILFMGIAGISPLEPGFSRCSIRPQPADFESIELTVQTIQGSIFFKSTGKVGARTIRIKLPDGCNGELILDNREKVPLEKVIRKNKSGLSHYKIIPRQEIEINLLYT
jgi:alpha-L-rhamnosidase